jgi:hypothetical protein
MARLLPLLALLVAGCDPIAGRSIFLHSAQAANYSSESRRFSVSAATDSDVHATVAIVERVTAAHGFHRGDPRYLNPGGIATFSGQHKADGSTPGCDIYVHPEKGTVEVRFQEWARFSSSELIRSLDQEVFAALIKRFGSDRVTRKA